MLSLRLTHLNERTLQRKTEAFHPIIDVLLTMVNVRLPEVHLRLFVLRRELIATHPEIGTTVIQVH
jgi:hypothetical protein